MPERTYQIVVSVIFGIVGFAANFMDIQLFTSPEFKATLLLGLIFPLLITLARKVREVLDKT